MSDTTWAPVTVTLDSLTPWDRNPKTISKTHAKRLLDLWQRLGQFQTIAIGPGGEVYDGHQRLSVLRAAHGARFEVTALQASRALTEKEREELTVAAHVGTTGQFDWGELANWDTADLQDWGFDAEALQDWRAGLAALDAMLGAEVEDEPYSREIESPDYLPSNEKPQISALFDQSRTAQLIADIEAADSLTDDERAFLTVAAQRHTVLQFNRIADYYAHASPEMQRLMEDSALVIIDFKRAIALGYVDLTSKIAEMVRDEYGDE